MSDRVLATQVRKVDPPQFVAELDEEGELGGRGRLGLEQCDHCGNTYYDLIQHGGHWYVKCVPDAEGIYAGIEGVGCGAEYAVREMGSEEVAF